LQIGGSGALYLVQDKKWIRGLLRVVKANDLGRVSPHVVAGHMANLNNGVHLGVADRSVGPCCIVAWRYRKGGFHKGDCGHQAYIGTTQDTSLTLIPTIGNGMDITTPIARMMPYIIKNLESMLAGQPVKEFKHEIIAEIMRQDKPDETLR